MTLSKNPSVSPRGSGSSGLKRSTTPIPKRRAKKRAWKSPRCIGWSTDPAKKAYCKQPQRSIERCQPHADQYLDGLVREIVVTDRCMVPHPFAHAGALQPNHGIDRGEKSVRWDLRNVVSGCAALNVWAYHHKRQWYAMFREHVGAETYAALEAIADNPPKLDYEAKRDELTARLSELKGRAA